MRARTTRPVGPRPSAGRVPALHAATRAPIWSRCDWFSQLQRGGVAGLARARIDSWRALVVDALDELAEWIGDDADDAARGVAGVSLDDANDGGDENDSDFDDPFGAAQDPCPPSMRR